MADVPSVGMRLKIISELTLWDRQKFDARTKYQWPGISESAVVLPDGTIPGTETLRLLAIGTVIVVKQILLDTPNSKRNGLDGSYRYQAVLAEIDSGQQGIVWTIFDGKPYSEKMAPRIQVKPNEQCRYEVQVVQKTMTARAMGCAPMTMVAHIMWKRDDQRLHGDTQDPDGHYTQPLELDNADDLYKDFETKDTIGMSLNDKSTVILRIGLSGEMGADRNILVQIQNTLHGPASAKLPRQISIEAKAFNQKSRYVDIRFDASYIKRIMEGYATSVPAEVLASLAGAGSKFTTDQLPSLQGLLERLGILETFHVIGYKSRKSEWLLLPTKSDTSKYVIRNGALYMASARLGPVHVTDKKHVKPYSKPDPQILLEPLDLSASGYEVVEEQSSTGSTTKGNPESPGLYVIRSTEEPKRRLFVVKLETLRSNEDMQPVQYPPDQDHQDHFVVVRYHVYLASDWVASPHFSFFRASVGEVKSSNILYPVSQHILFFLPGVLGSTLSVGTPPDLVFPEVEILQNPTPAVIKLAAKPHGEPYLNVSKENLQIVTKAHLANVVNVGEVYPEDDHVANVLQKQFPKIKIKVAGEEQPLRHIIYRSVPYDWRLPLGPNSLSASNSKDKWPFLETIAKDIAMSITKILAEPNSASRYPFLSNRLSLAGHSTGGLLIRALLAMPEFAVFFGALSQVHNAFFINTPFWGAPKGEQGLLTGKLDVNGAPVAPISLLDDEIFRNVGCDLFVPYLLAPTTKYSTATRHSTEAMPEDKEYWSEKSMKSRFSNAIRCGVYRTFRPGDKFEALAKDEKWVKTWAEAKSMYSENIAQHAKRLHAASESPQSDVNIYVFHSTLKSQDMGAKTICGLKLPVLPIIRTQVGDLSDQWKAIVAAKAPDRIEKLKLLMGATMPAFGWQAPQCYLVDDETFALYDTVSPEYGPREEWFCILNYYTDSLELKISVLKEWPSPTVVKRSGIGDGTVPTVSQITLGDLAKKFGKATLMVGIRQTSEAESKPNPKPTPLGHADVCREDWVWAQIGRSFFRSDMLDVSMPWPETIKDISDMLWVYEKDLKFDSSNEEDVGVVIPPRHGIEMFSDS